MCSRAKPRFSLIIDKLELSTIQKDIIKDRYISLVEETRNRASNISILYHTSHLIVTVGSLIVPALMSIQYMTAENQLYWTPTLAPNLIDLYRLYQFIVLNKRTTVLEFGSGWSTLVISMALKEVKEKYNKVVKKFNLRRNNLFELFCVDNEKKYLNITKKRIFSFNRINKISKPIKVHYNFSDCLIEQFEGRYSTFYKRIPLCNPDFIYLDGPNLFNIKNKINNFTTAHPDMMPMGNDIIKIEYFLTPGTIILTDGRSANAKFLRDFFKRKWLYNHEKNFDQHIF
jgi:hypothetical protein